MEWGHVCPTITFPCPGGNQDLTMLSTSSSDSTSFRGQHLSVVWRGEILKVLSQGCRLDPGTLSIQVVLWASEVVLMVWGLALCRSNISHRFLSGRTHWKHFYIFVSMLIYVSELTVIPLCFISRRITPSQSQCTLTIMFVADGERQGTALFLLLYPALFFVHCSFRLHHCHKHCRAIYECSPLFLSLQQGTVITACYL